MRLRMKQGKYVAYYRVSTKEQGKSGLGLDAQKETVANHTIDGTIINEYVEVESGKKNNRLQLNNAIRHSQDNDATLVIAKLDRLSRNASFIFALRDSGVDFVCCDIPDMNTLTVGIFATMAQHEREVTSQRTKAALAELKKKGIRLGSPNNLTDYSRMKAKEAIKAKAKNNDNNKRAIALIKSLREQGLSYNKIANKLNEAGYKTSRGNKFYSMSVKQLEKQFCFF